jgi:hypothetical protein
MSITIPIGINIPNIAAKVARYLLRIYLSIIESILKGLRFKGLGQLQNHARSFKL